MATETEDTYAVRDGDVWLSIKVGNGQFSNSTVVSGAGEIDIDPVKKKYLLGRGGELVGKGIKVATVVAHTNASSDTMVVTYELDGGVTNKSYELTEAAPAGGKPLVFQGKFTFESE